MLSPDLFFLKLVNAPQGKTSEFFRDAQVARAHNAFTPQKNPAEKAGFV